MATLPLVCSLLVKSNFPRGTTNQKDYPDLGSDTSSVWNFCASYSDTFGRERRPGSVAKCRLFSQATLNGEITHWLRIYIFLTQQFYNSFHFISTDLRSFPSCIRASFVLGAVLKRVFDSMGDCTHRLKSFY